jgi:hypothetical protein
LAGGGVGVAGIYLWHNKLTGKTYVGQSVQARGLCPLRTYPQLLAGGLVNLKKRFESYRDIYYLNRTKNLMPICAALLKYGHDTFDFYIIEVITAQTKQILCERYAGQYQLLAGIGRAY